MSRRRENSCDPVSFINSCESPSPFRLQGGAIPQWVSYPQLNQCLLSLSRLHNYVHFWAGSPPNVFSTRLKPIESVVRVYRFLEQKMKIKVEKPTAEQIAEMKKFETWSKEESVFDWEYDMEETCYTNPR